jgi:hypothetical protein
MTKAERENFFRLNRARERAAKNALAARAAQLWADFERQMDTYYAFDQEPVWKEAMRQAEEVVTQMQAKVNDQSQALGIPKRFAPTIYLGWQGQHYALEKLRIALRKTARAQLDAGEKAGRIEIERKSLEIQTELVADSLSTTAAKEFLERLPSVEALMPPLELKELLGTTEVDRNEFGQKNGTS